MLINLTLISYILNLSHNCCCCCFYGAHLCHLISSLSQHRPSLNTDSKSGGVKNSRVSPTWHLEGRGRRFLGAGGQGSRSGILASRPVGVVGLGSPSSSLLASSPVSHTLGLGFVDIGFRAARIEIPVTTHFLASASTPASAWDFFEHPIHKFRGGCRGD